MQGLKSPHFSWSSISNPSLSRLWESSRVCVLRFIEQGELSFPVLYPRQVQLQSFLFAPTHRQGQSLLILISGEPWQQQQNPPKAKAPVTPHSASPSLRMWDFLSTPRSKSRNFGIASAGAELQLIPVTGGAGQRGGSPPARPPGEELPMESLLLLLKFTWWDPMCSAAPPAQQQSKTAAV